MSQKEDNKDKKVYVIINDKKEYIDPEIVKKYGLDREAEKDKSACFTGLKLHVEKS